MVTVNQGIKEVRESSSRFIHRMEAGLVTVYGWVSGPAMTEQERTNVKLVETEPLRRFPQTPI